MENNQSYFSVEQADKNEQKIFVWGNVISLLLFLSLVFLNTKGLRYVSTFNHLFIFLVSGSCTIGVLVGIFGHRYNLALLTKMEVTISLATTVAVLVMMYTFPSFIKDTMAKDIFIAVLMILPACVSSYSLTRFCIRILLD